MPTTIAVISPNTGAWRTVGKIFAFLSNPDLIAVTSFAVIGLLVAIGLAFCLPLPSDPAAFLIQAP
jgi:hypothetical protein